MMDFNGEEEKASMRGDEESSCQHIGDVDAGSNTENGSSLPPPAAPKSRNYKYKLLTLLVVILLIAAIALAIGLATRPAEEENASTSDIVVGINEAVNEQTVTPETATFEFVDKDGNVLSTFTAETATAAPSVMPAAPSVMPSVQIIASKSPSMPLSSHPSSNPTSSPVSSPPSTSPVMAAIVSTARPTPAPAVDTDNDDFLGLGVGLFGDPDDPDDADDDDDGGCFDGLADLACCAFGILCG